MAQKNGLIRVGDRDHMAVVDPGQSSLEDAAVDAFDEADRSGHDEVRRVVNRDHEARPAGPGKTGIRKVRQVDAMSSQHPRESVLLPEQTMVAAGGVHGVPDKSETAILQCRISFSPGEDEHLVTAKAEMKLRTPQKLPDIGFRASGPMRLESDRADADTGHAGEPGYAGLGGRPCPWRARMKVIKA